MFRQVFLCVWKRRSRPEEERRRQGRSGASAPYRTAPSARRRVNSGNTSHLGSRSAWLLGGRRTVRDDRAGTGAHRRSAGGSGKRSDSLSRSLTGRRMPNAALSRACANYGCKAHGRGCRVRGPSGPRQAHAVGTAEPARRAVAVRCVSVVTRRAETLQGLDGADRRREP